MDLLSRLIAGTGASPGKKVTNTPAERLATCKRACNALQHLWRSGSSISEDETAKLQVVGYIKRLNSLLHDESRKTAPHSCLQYACSTQIFIIVTKLAVSAEDEAITSSSVQFFHILINGETDSLLDAKIFARSLIDLVRKSRGTSQKGEADLVELLFEICAKIRIDPDILSAWFYPERRRNSAHGGDNDRFRPSSRSESLVRQDQFPLFYVLVDFVHNDGSSGDFARTGLLYLIETTSKSRKLEKWMIESDLAPQMASGLGALYSRLSRTPASVPQTDIFQSSSVHATLPEVGKNRRRMPGEFSNEEAEKMADDESTDTQQSIKAFLSYLAFWQDTLNHCSSSEVADTLLDHFQILFVRQLLYPSLLESSDMDGGSTAAVLAHLYRILNALEHRQLLDSMLDYLLSSQARNESSVETKRRPRMSVSRRKSMDKLAAMTQSSADPSPALFDLLDLITLSLSSSRTQTKVAALKLVSIMLQQHHDLVFHTLFKVQQCDTISQSRESFDQDLIQLFKTAMSIMDIPGVDQSYQALLEDVQFMINEHSCGFLLDEAGLQLMSSTPRRFEMRQDCRLMETIRNLFQTFFTNDTMTNVALTETVMCLATCKLIKLHYWLLPGSEDSSHTDDCSIVHILHSQVEQIRRWRGQYLEWDELYSLQLTKLLGTPATISTNKSPKRESLDRTNTSTGRASSDASPRTRIASPLRRSSADHDTEDHTKPSEHDNLLQMPVEVSNSQEPPNSSANLSSLAGRLSLEARGATLSSSTSSEGMSSGAATPQFSEQPSTGTTRLPASTVLTLEHVLTNAIILQEFLLEIAAVVQIRASFFGEVEVEHPSARSE